MAAIGGYQSRTLRDFVTLVVQGISSSIARLTTKVNNFALKPALISMAQQSQFRATLLEDHKLHLSAF